MTNFPGRHVPQDDDSADPPKDRQCLRCNEKFESSWSGERICKRCKQSMTWRTGATYTASSGGRKR